MGIVDIIILNKIYQECNRLEKLWNWGYSFQQDSGDFETVIAFYKDTNVSVPYVIIEKGIPEASRHKYKVLVPDIIDRENKIIIEYEEESKPNKGPKIRKKGHWEESKRDTERDNYYHNAGYRVCKIWESYFKSKDWKTKLFIFLSNCYRNQTTH